RQTTGPAALLLGLAISGRSEAAIGDDFVHLIARQVHSPEAALECSSNYAATQPPSIIEVVGVLATDQHIELLDRLLVRPICLVNEAHGPVAVLAGAPRQDGHC